MRTFFIGIGYLVTISLYISFILLPYYIAYSFIEPRSFLGVVGVFIFGSVIVPLVIWGVALMVGLLGLSFNALAEKKVKSSKYQMKTINEVSSKKHARITYILGFSLAIAICLIIYLVVVTTQEKDSVENYYTEDNSAASEAIADAEEVEIFENETINYNPEGDTVTYNETTDENISTQSEGSLRSSPDLVTLGPSHLSLNIWFKDAIGSSFDLDFRNVKRPEINSVGSCSNISSNLEKTTRFSKLINKQLNVHSIYECDNNMTVEVSMFTENNESHLIMTLNQTDNPNRVYYSGEMTRP